MISNFTIENIAKKEKLKVCENLEDTLQFLKDNPTIMNYQLQTYTTAQLMTKIDHDKLSSLEDEFCLDNNGID